MQTKFLRLFLALVFSYLVFHPLIINAQDSIPGNFCVSQEEVKLFNLINDYRKAMNLPNVNLSKSLCYVAEKHIEDLITNKPDTNTCNFHSWSDKGSWTSCCYEKDIKDRSCMQNKPRELTNYPGIAYEIVYWENKTATANKAFDQWRETPASRACITNFKQWEDKQWKTIGIGIKKGFAIAWFGEEIDPQNIGICGTNQIIENKTEIVEQESEIITKPSGRFYIIVGSFTTLEDAKNELTKHKEGIFKKAKIIAVENKYRISLADYPTKELANEAKQELPENFQGAWVMEF